MLISFVVQVILFACEVNNNWTYNLAEFAKQQVQPILYSYNVLKVATKDFHPSNKLGEGGFGAVYKVFHISTSLQIHSVFPVFNV
jgi:hypothetical protein